MNLLRIFVIAVIWLLPLVARADAVDDAFARGNAAAKREQWDEAAAAYQQALRLLDAPSAELHYDLGTAEAHRGNLGMASYHLRRAVAPASAPTPEIAEAARMNLDVVRRRAELEAASRGAQIDRPETWWDLMLEALRAPWLGALAILSGWSFVLLLGFERWRRAKGAASNNGVTGALLIVLGVVFTVAGALHAMALRADRTAPQAIVIAANVEARERPGLHARTTFKVQSGARVRIVDHTPGWSQIRLSGAMEGWVRTHDVAELEARELPVMHSRTTATSQTDSDPSREPPDRQAP